MWRISLFLNTVISIVLFGTISKAQWVHSGFFHTPANIVAADGSTLYASASGLLRSTDQGERWSSVLTIKPEENTAQCLTRCGPYLFVGMGNGVYRSSDDGLHWSKMSSGITVGFITSLAGTDSILYAGAAGGYGIFRTVDYGSNWTPVEGWGLSDWLVRTLVLRDKYLFAGTWGGLFVSADSGFSWSQSVSPISGKVIYSLAVMDTMVFAGIFGGIFRSTDNGQTWASSSVGLTNPAINTITRSGSMLYAGTNGGVFRSSDSGATWMAMNEGLSDPTVTSLTFCDSFMFAGTAGGMFRSTDQGGSWVAVNSNKTPNSTRVVVSNDNGIFAASWDGQKVYHSADDGVTWSPIGAQLGSAEINTLAVSDSNLYVGSNAGIARTSDLGVTWNGFLDGYHLTNYLLVDGTDLYAGTEIGVFWSLDSGRTWKRDSVGLTAPRTRALVFKGPDLFAGSFGGIFRSTDRGKTWSGGMNGLTTPHVSTLAVHGTTLFAGTLGGGVFRSTDDGASWVPSNSGMTGPEINAILVHQGTVYLGTRQGVFYSTDDGSTWAQCNDGLIYPWVHSLSVRGTRLFAGTLGWGVASRPLDEIVTSVNPAPGWSITDFELLQNYPNPFNGSTSVRFELPRRTHVTLGIFDLLGREVAVLVDDELGAGKHSVRWEAGDLPSGIYFYRLRSGSSVETRRLILLK